MNDKIVHVLLDGYLSCRGTRCSVFVVTVPISSAKYHVSIIQDHVLSLILMCHSNQKLQLVWVLSFEYKCKKFCFLQEIILWNYLLIVNIQHCNPWRERDIYFLI